MKKDTMFIGGEWVPSAGDRTIDVISPHTEEVIATVAEADPSDIDRAVAAARKAFDEGPWPRTSPKERADVLCAIVSGIQGRAQEFADTVTSEMGAPSNFSIFGQVMAATMIMDGFADLVETFELEQERPGLMGPVLVEKVPVGVCAGIIPWNVPLFIISMKLGACLASGSTMIVKSAPETPLTGFLLGEVLESVGLPPGVVNIIAADREMSEQLVRHPGVDKVSFTGSTAAGMKIGGICGEQLKRCTLELGGKSAAIVLDDADLEAIAPSSRPSFADVDISMKIAREEIFGPVLSVIPYETVEDAVRIANDSDYGLSGSVWGSDVGRSTAVGKQLRTGTVAINSGAVLDLKNPFGGFKKSGIGREMGPEGLEAYLETQTIILPAPQ